MNLIPFSFRHVPRYQFDGDGRFPHNRIKGADKRYLRKRQIKKYVAEMRRVGDFLCEGY